ncbi:protein MKS1-like [Phalaenopsis equestris]|uniref:protein MKS1-like n=1 Tax=Phalaenopsis equestris TaxID=78828 RepID=UPI0009E21AF5|nr:protein MKS1-like [Phalaenopsis equestris]
MDLFEQPRGRPSPKRGIQLQGPRPTPLKVNKDSHKLKKPSFPPPPPTHLPAAQRRPPVIIYTVSPKIIHTKPSEFMSLVQRLTGCSASEAAAAAAATDPSEGNLSADKQSSPAQNRASKEQDDTDELRRLVIGGASANGIQPISPNFFSPSVVDINQFNFFHELNVPALHGNKGMMDGGFISSPGNFFFSL